MNAQQLNEIIQASEERMLQLESRKGEEYVRGDADRLANFKRIAAMLGLKPMQVWAVYFTKHFDALINFIRTGQERSENIEGRIDDLTVYLKLFRGLVHEHKHARKSPSTQLGRRIKCQQ